MKKIHEEDIKFSEQIRNWLIKKAAEEDLSVNEYINKLISQQMEEDNSIKQSDEEDLDSDMEKYRQFIKEYMKIIRKF